EPLRAYPERAVRSRRLLYPVREDQGRAGGGERPPAVDRRALRIARGLRGEGESGGGGAGPRPPALAGGCRRLCQCGGDERPVLTWRRLGNRWVDSMAIHPTSYRRQPETMPAINRRTCRT